MSVHGWLGNSPWKPSCWPTLITGSLMLQLSQSTPWRCWSTLDIEASCSCQPNWHCDRLADRTGTQHASAAIISVHWQHVCNSSTEHRQTACQATTAWRHLELLAMEGRCGHIMQTSTRRVKTQRVVITFLRVVDLIQSQRIFYYALVHWPINGLLIYNALAESMLLRVA